MEEPEGKGITKTLVSIATGGSDKEAQINPFGTGSGTPTIGDNTDATNESSPAPNYRDGEGEEVCGKCANFDNGTCKLYNFKTDSDKVCDSYAPSYLDIGMGPAVQGEHEVGDMTSKQAYYEGVFAKCAAIGVNELLLLKYAEEDKMHQVMSEFKRGTLKTGSGEKVTNRKQAIAIGLSYKEADCSIPPQYQSKMDKGKKNPKAIDNGPGRNGKPKAVVVKKTKVTIKKANVARLLANLLAKAPTKGMLPAPGPLANSTTIAKKALPPHMSNVLPQSILDKINKQAEFKEDVSKPRSFKKMKTFGDKAKKTEKVGPQAVGTETLNMDANNLYGNPAAK